MGFKVLIHALAVLVMATAANAAGGDPNAKAGEVHVCPVGEFEPVDECPIKFAKSCPGSSRYKLSYGSSGGYGQGGVCNQHNNPQKAHQKCREYCEEMYGGELKSSVCAPRPCTAQGKGNATKSECICNLKCCNQGGWGDPHWWTCDGATFGYQGEKEFYVLKPCKKYPTLPNFVITQTNRVGNWRPAATIKESWLKIEEWNNFVMKVTVPDPSIQQGWLLNGAAMGDSGILYNECDDYSQDYIRYRKEATPDGHLVTVETSFGLRIRYTSHAAGYSDISIDTPRHPELKGRMCGLIGRWNDNINDEGLDANGKFQELEAGFSSKFGDSWLVDRAAGSGCDPEKIKAEKAAKVDKLDAGTKAYINGLCQVNLRNPELEVCAKSLNTQLPQVEDCAFDVMLMEESKRDDYIIAMVARFAARCGKQFPYKEPDLCIKNKATLFALYQRAKLNHFYTVSNEEVLQKTIQSAEFYWFDTLGIVATQGDEYGCGLKPIYRLHGNKTGDFEHDSFYTDNEAEAEDAVNSKGYVKEGIAFYCAKKEKDCGANVALRRYVRKTIHGYDHFYTNNEAEGNRIMADESTVKGGAVGKIIGAPGKLVKPNEQQEKVGFENIMCWIWKHPDDVKQ